MLLGYVFHKIKLKNFFYVILIFATCFCIFSQLIPAFIHTKHHIILWWTPFMGEVERTITCTGKYDCLLTKDRNYINSTNLQAILFYGSKLDISDLPIPKTKTWAIFHEESPRNVALFLYNGTYNVFEIVSTFSRYSDFPLTLQYLENLSIITDDKYIVNIQRKNEFLIDIAPVLYLQSDCDTPIERDAYVSELMKYVQVDSYGACLNNKHFPEEIAKLDPMDLYSDALLSFIAKYKFIIAFENGICDDYITEKLWRPLIVGSVPIYLGSPTVQDWLPNKNSAILAKDFQNPKQLAQFIKKVNADDSLYQTFLEHKFGKVENEFLKSNLAQGPFGINTEEEHPISAFECFVCQRIHEGLSGQKRTKSVYDCSKPRQGNVWEYYWESGDCQSKALVNSVESNVKLESDPC